MNKDHLDIVSVRSAVNPDYLPYTSHRTAPYLLWDDAVSHASSSRTCCTCTCCRAVIITLVVFLVASVFAIVGVVVYLGIITNNTEDIPIEEEIFEGNMRIIEGDRYSSGLRDRISPEFIIKAQTYETLINSVYQRSPELTEAFIRAEVTAFQNGSLVVYFRLHLDRRKLPESAVQLAYDVMLQEIERDQPVAFKAVRVDPETLNISGASALHHINFIDFFANEEVHSENLGQSTSAFITNDKETENPETLTSSVETESSITFPTTLDTTQQQSSTHNVDYGRWEPFTVVPRPVIDSNINLRSNPNEQSQQTITPAVSRGSVSEISFDWAPEEGVAAFFPSSTATTRRVGVGVAFTLSDEADNSQEFNSRVLPPDSDEMVFRMGSPSLTIKRGQPSGNSPSPWVPLSPLLAEPTSKELLASRDDPQLGFGLRLSSPNPPLRPQVNEPSSPITTSKNVLLRNQSSHAVIVRLPPGTRPQRNDSRLSSLQSRRKEWQRSQRVTLEEEREAITSSISEYEDSSEPLSISSSVAPNGRVVPASKVNVNNLRYPVLKNYNRRETEEIRGFGIREPKQEDLLEDEDSIASTRVTIVTSVSEEHPVEREAGLFGKRRNRLRFPFREEPRTITSVVTSVAEEYGTVTPSSSSTTNQAFTILPTASTTDINDTVPRKPEFDNFDNNTKQESQSSPSSVNLLDFFSSRDVDNNETTLVPDETLAPNDDDDHATWNLFANIRNLSHSPYMEMESRNRSAAPNSVVFNDDDDFFSEESDEDLNHLLSTGSLELLSATRKSAVITTSTFSPASLNRCKSPTLFQCDSGECVSIFSRCNRIRDCMDNSDEGGCTCADFIRANIINSTLCDGVVDCWDYSDENQCEWCNPSMYVCPNARLCIERSQLCDGFADCPGGDDEKACVTIAPNITSAEDGSYWSSGLVMVRKQGQWGKLCMQNFENFVSETQVAIGDLSRVLCHTMGYGDFEEGKELTEPLQRGRDAGAPYYEPQYNNSSDSRSLGIEFVATMCDSREVIAVRCKDFGCGRRHQSVQSRARIVGGSNSTPGSWPWQAAVYKEGNFMCGATLINDQWLLSAAHCFYQAIDHYWTVRLGVLRRGSHSPYERIHRLSHVILHPNYIANNFINDIGLLRMEKPVPFSVFIRPICLPTVEETAASITSKQTCTVVGWGQVDEEGDYLPDTLQETKLPLISAQECRTHTTALTSYARVNQNMFCAGIKRGGRDACLGDSGGPLMCQQRDGRWTLTGITSNGFGCARALRPGIYTKVVNYKAWINKITEGTLPRPVLSSCNGHRCPLGKCLSKRHICDGFVDCMDESDEKGCTWSHQIHS